jgi:hypothetical protein
MADLGIAIVRLLMMLLATINRLVVRPAPWRRTVRAIETFMVDMKKERMNEIEGMESSVKVYFQWSGTVSKGWMDDWEHPQNRSAISKSIHHQKPERARILPSKGGSMEESGI